MLRCVCTQESRCVLFRVRSLCVVRNRCSGCASMSSTDGFVMNDCTPNGRLLNASESFDRSAM